MARNQAIQERMRTAKANLSPLMKMKAKALQGEIVNVCPFKCEDRHLDDHGYCHHLVGFTDAKLRKKGLYEPLIRRKINGIVFRTNDGFGKQKLQAGDKFCRITSSWRVYRDVKPSEDDIARMKQADVELDEEEEEPEEEEIGEEELEELTRPTRKSDDY